MTPHRRIGGFYASPIKLTQEEVAELKSTHARNWDAQALLPSGFDLPTPHACGSRRGIMGPIGRACRRCGRRL